MSYFEEGATLPSPFNIIPSPKSIYYLFGWIKRHLFRKPTVKRQETFESLGVRSFQRFDSFCVVTTELHTFLRLGSYRSKLIRKNEITHFLDKEIRHRITVYYRASNLAKQERSPYHCKHILPFVLLIDIIFNSNCRDVQLRMWD